MTRSVRAMNIQQKIQISWILPLMPATLSIKALAECNEFQKFVFQCILLFMNFQTEKMRASNSFSIKSYGILKFCFSSQVRIWHDSLGTTVTCDNWLFKHKTVSNILHIHPTSPNGTFKHESH